MKNSFYIIELYKDTYGPVYWKECNHGTNLYGVPYFSALVTHCAYDAFRFNDVINFPELDTIALIQRDERYKSARFVKVWAEYSFDPPKTDDGY